MKDKSQERVNEIIAMAARGERFVSLSDIDLCQVKTSSLHLFYKAVNANVLTLLVCQQILVDELADREKRRLDIEREKKWQK